LSNLVGVVNTRAFTCKHTHTQHAHTHTHTHTHTHHHIRYEPEEEGEDDTDASLAHTRALTGEYARTDHISLA
jgi:hypothetical protein